MYYTIVMTHPAEAYGAAKMLGGIAFSLGFILVVIAGGELFTGNNLIVMAWAQNKVSTERLMANWGIVYLANAVGALIMVYLVYVSGYLSQMHHEVGVTALKLGLAKASLSSSEAFVRGIFCNALVCLASWMVYASRTVIDKIFAVLFPISAFVAMGFEHCIANMFMIPLAMIAAMDESIVAASGLTPEALSSLNLEGLMANIIPVTLGNILGGAVMVAMAYYIVYLYGRDG
jgi:formate/nitrite transporter